MLRLLWNSIIALLFAAVGFAAERRPLLVISVDGLDYRYLRDADKLGMKIPNMRRLVREGAVAKGVIGVVPTVTWPSHTTIISGVAPHAHGILGNRRPKSEGGEYYWSTSLLKTKTLLDAARAAGLKSAAITWPVTVDAPVDYNLPEYFQKRNGGAMDLPSIESKGTPGIVKEIVERFPSFAQFWMDDRTRALATIFFLERKKPDLTLLHFVDHDAAAHEHGPFSREAKAAMEYTDELIGDMLKAAPKDLVIALVSAHDFERTDKIVNLRDLAKDQVTITPFLLIARNSEAAGKIRALKADSKFGIGREIPLEEFKQLAPQLGDAVAVWEPSEHFAFSAGQAGSTELYSTPNGKGNHGLWPTRPDYRSVFVLWGSGVKSQQLAEMRMTEITERLAGVLAVTISR
jgi:predicted AlkP superfamily pyrophosphatase or phosphodiesterase